MLNFSWSLMLRRLDIILIFANTLFSIIDSLLAFHPTFHNCSEINVQFIPSNVFKFIYNEYAQFHVLFE